MHDSIDLAVLQAVAEQLAIPTEEHLLTGVATDIDDVSGEQSLQALTRLTRGTTLLGRDDHPGARAELEAALELGRRHGFEHLTMQCQVLLGVIARTSDQIAVSRFTRASA